jgi:hypothetical protein
MTHRINPIVVIKETNLDTSRIYNRNHIVGMDKMFSTMMHQRKNKQGLHYKTTMMRNTIYAQT